MNTPDEFTQRLWGMLHPANTAAPEPEPEPVALPTDMGLYVIKDGTSAGRWAATIYAVGPNGQYYQTLPVVPTSADAIRERLFEGQQLERLIPASEADL